MKKLIFIAAIFILLAMLFSFLPSHSVQASPDPSWYNSNSVEIISKRTRNSKTFHLGNGRFCWEGSIGAIHYKDNPANPNEPWKEIDNTLIPRDAPSYDWEMNKAGYQAYFKESFSQRKVLKFEKQGEFLKIEPGNLSWINGKDKEQIISSPQNVPGKTKENKIYWKDAYGEGLDFEWICNSTRLAKHLIIKNFARLPKPSFGESKSLFLELNLSFDFSEGITPYANGKEFVKGRIETQGIIELRSPEGEVLWGFMPLRFWDSSKPPKEGIAEPHVELKDKNLNLQIRVPYSWLKKANFPVYIDAAVDEQVGASTDDANRVDGSFIPARVPFDLSWTDRYIKSGFRFTTVGVPQGATINTAYLSFKARQNWESGGTLTIKGDDEDNCATFSDETDFVNRPETNAYVEWSMPAFSDGTWYDTCDISPVIQEIIDRSGWVSGNALAILTFANNQTSHRIYCFDDEASLAPKLHIEYTVGYLLQNLPTDISAVLEEDESVNCTQTPQSQAKWVLLKDAAGNRMGKIKVHFENATADIDLSNLTSNIDISAKKSALYRSSWPGEIETSKTLYIPCTNSSLGVYICLNATSLGEVSYADRDFTLSLGQTKSGVTLQSQTITKNGQEYYKVTGITGTGGGENPTPVGGTIYRVNKLKILAPWIGLILALLLLISLSVFYLRRHQV